MSVILGQPLPWNVLPAAKEKSLQRNAHTTLQDDLKRPESEEAARLEPKLLTTPRVTKQSSTWC